MNTKLKKYQLQTNTIGEQIKFSALSARSGMSKVSMVVSVLMVLATTIGAYSVAEANFTDINFRLINISKEVLTIVFVLFVFCFGVLLETTKTNLINSVISASTWVSFLVLGAGTFFIYGLAGNYGYVEMSVTDSEIYMMTSGVIFFGSLLLSTVLTDKKNKKGNKPSTSALKEFHTVFAFVSYLVIIAATVMFNFYAVGTYSENLQQDHKLAKASNTDILEVRQHRSELVDDLRGTNALLANLRNEKIALKKAHMAEKARLAKNRDSEIRIIREEYLGNSQAEKDEKWRYARSIKAEIKSYRIELNALNEQIDKESNKASMLIRSKETKIEDIEKIKTKLDKDFEETKTWKIELSGFIAIWGELLCSLLIVLKAFLHKTNPSVEGVDKVGENLTKTKEIGIEPAKKSEDTPLKNILKGNL